MSDPLEGPRSLFGSLLTRFKARKADSEKPKDAAAKEKRQFPVHAMVVLLNLLSCTFWGLSGTVPLAVNDYFNFDAAAFPSALTNTQVGYLLLAAPILHLDTSVVSDALIVKPPRRTFPTDHNPYELNTAELLARLLQDTLPDSGIIPTLPHFLRVLGYHAEALMVEIPWEQQTFFSDLANLCLESYGQPLAPSTQFENFAARYPRPSQLVLKTRRYFSRGDERAFVVDSGLIRPLVGSILQAIFLPRRMSDRKSLPTNSVNPHRNKNIIEMTVTYAVGTAVYIAVSDTSSFTSSGVNTWIMLLSILTLLKNPLFARLKRAFNVVIQGQFLTVTLESVISLYLWYTVGIRCWSEDTNDSYTSQGGYLGVSANITLCLLAQSLQLIVLRTQLIEKLVACVFQSGGDDIFSLVAGLSSNCMDALAVIERSLGKFVGHQKEFAFVRLDTLPDGDHCVGLTFCKKELRCLKTSHGEAETYALYSLRDLPVMEQLLTSTPRTEIAREKEFKSYSASAKDAARLFPQALSVYGEMVELYSRVKAPPPLTTLIPTQRIVSPAESEIVEVGSDLYSLSAYRAVCGTQCKESIAGPANFTFDLKANALLLEDKICVRVLKDSGAFVGLHNITVTKREASKAVASRAYKALPVFGPNSEDFEELVSWLTEYRLELGV